MSLDFFFFFFLIDWGGEGTGVEGRLPGKRGIDAPNELYPSRFSLISVHPLS